MVKWEREHCSYFVGGEYCAVLYAVPQRPAGAGSRNSGSDSGAVRSTHQPGLQKDPPIRHTNHAPNGTRNNAPTGPSVHSGRPIGVARPLVPSGSPPLHVSTGTNEHRDPSQAAAAARLAVMTEPK